MLAPPASATPKPSRYARAQALLARAVADADPRIGGGELVGDVARAVGRAVIDHEQDAPGSASRIAAEMSRQVLPLVVGRQDDPGTGPDAARAGRLHRRDRRPDGRLHGRVEIRRGECYGQCLQGSPSWPIARRRPRCQRPMATGTVIVLVRPPMSLALILSVAGPADPGATLNDARYCRRSASWRQR